MKKILVLLLTVCCFTSIFATTACKSTKNGSITIAVPDGAPVLALYSLMENVNVLENYEIKYRVLSGAENIGKTLISGQADCAVMPVNVASKLYNAGNDLKLASVNVFGVLYMVGKTPLDDEQLKGKVIATIGKGATPDLSLKIVLQAEDIEWVDSDVAVQDKVALSYVADAPTAMRMLAKGDADYAILGEPVATTACNNLKAQIVMDIQQKWAEVVGDNTFVQAGLVMRSNVYENTELANALLDRLSRNKDIILSRADKVKATIQKFGSSLQADFTTEMLERCNLGCALSSDIRPSVEKYFNAVLAFDAQFIGGKLPDDGFYYGLN